MAGLSRIINLEKPNTLSQFLSEKEQEEIVSLKITGYIGYKDFDDVLDSMCDTCGEYDEDDNFIPDYELTAAIRHLDLGGATYVDGDDLPYFGFHAPLETFILPKGVKSTLENGEYDTGLQDSETLTMIVLPDGLKIVGGFNSCENLTDLVLPESLEEIESYAFCGCKSIKSIRIPAKVRRFDGSCFADCMIEAYEVDKNNPFYVSVDGVVYSKDMHTLVAFPSAYPQKQFVVPETTKAIGDSAFMFSNVENIILPSGLVKIEDNAFESSSIRNIAIPNSVISIGKLAFRFCTKLECLNLSESLSTIPEQLISSCLSLKTLEIPSSVRILHYSAFAWCENLEHLILNDGLEEIADDGVMMINGGQLKEIHLPKTLKKIPGGAFNYSPFIKAFSLNPENPYFSIIDDALCSKDRKVLYSVPNFDRDSFVVPEGIEVISERVFAFMPNLKSVILPSSLRSIESRAFQNVESLKELRIPSGVIEVDIDALWADSLKTIIMDGSLPPHMTGYVRDDEWRYRDVNLIVPKGSENAYQSSIGWKSFHIKSSQ
jgi:hypothetical protein